MECVRRLEQVACDPPEPLARAAFTEGIILLTLAPLRFPGSRNIASTKTSKSAILGSLRYSKTADGTALPWAAHWTGMKGEGDWTAPLFRVRERLRANADTFRRSYFLSFLTVGEIYGLLLQPFPQRG